MGGPEPFRGAMVLILMEMVIVGGGAIVKSDNAVYLRREG